MKSIQASRGSKNPKALRTSHKCGPLSVPGTMGSPAAMADCLAATLSPIFAMTCAVGPTKATPLSSHALAKSDRSERKP